MKSMNGKTFLLQNELKGAEETGWKVNWEMSENNEKITSFICMNITVYLAFKKYINLSN